MSAADDNDVESKVHLLVLERPNDYRTRRLRSKPGRCFT
jgi:hypothetical protein